MNPDLERSARTLNCTIRLSEILTYLQNDCFLTKTSAANYIDHRDVRIIEDAIRSGKLRAYRVGKKVLVKKSDLESWVMRGEITMAHQVEHKNNLQRLMDRAIEKARETIAARKGAHV